MDSRILLPPLQLPDVESAAFLKTTHPVTHPDRTPFSRYDLSGKRHHAGHRGPPGIFTDPGQCAFPQIRLAPLGHGS